MIPSAVNARLCCCKLFCKCFAQQGVLREVEVHNDIAFFRGQCFQRGSDSFDIQTPDNLFLHIAILIDSLIDSCVGIQPLVCSYVCVDPKGGVLSQVGSFLQRRGYRIKVFNSIDFSKSMHYNPLAYIKNEADILKFVDALISNTKGEGKEGDPFWTKAETLLYCALIAYIIFEGPAEDRNMNTLVDMISGMEVKEDDENYLNAVDYKRKLESCI